MTEAVTSSNLIAIASLVSEISLATDRQTHRQTYRETGRQTDRQTTWLHSIFFKIIRTLKTKMGLEQQ